MNLPQTLLADPTFSLMTRAERIAEAMALMTTATGDADPLDAAMAVEEAEALATEGCVAPVETVQAPKGVEPCREDRSACNAPVAGNGRCIECGAQRQETVLTPGPKVIAETPTAITYDLRGVKAALAAAREVPGVKSVKGPILARFREVTGNKDREIADMIGLARSSVQAIAGGRVGENLAPSQLQALRNAAAGQAKALQDLVAELEDRISG